MNLRRLHTAGRSSFLFLGLVAAAACSGGASNSGSTTGADSSRHDVAIVSTSESGLQLFSPYNYVFDVAGTGTPCVGWASPGAKSAQVTNLTTNVAVNYITSLSSLEEKLGVDVSVSAKADTPTGISGAGQLTSNYLQSLTQGNASYSYLLTAQQTYDVVAASPIKMVSQPATPTQFLQACGDSFARGLRVGASVSILMTIDAPSRSQADSIAVGIGGNVGGTVGVANASGNVTTNTTSSTTSSQSQFHVTFALQTTGFAPSNVSIPTASDPTGIATAVSALTGYVASLTASIKTDMAADVTAGGTSTSRNAVPVNVIRGFYSQTNGFDTSHGDPFATINPLLDSARSFVNDMGYLKEQLDDVYYGEIEAFMNATDQSKFNLVAGAPPQTVAGVAAIVTAQEAIFRPTGGSGMIASNVSSPVRGQIYSCLESAQTSSYAACSADPTKVAAYQTALQTLDAYAANSRVLPTHFVSSGDSRTYVNCSAATAQVGTQMALITPDQAAVLAPYIAGDPEQCAWVDGGSCGGLDYAYYSAAQGNQCGLALLNSCDVLCVPPNGLFNTPPQIGTGSIPASPTLGGPYGTPSDAAATPAAPPPSAAADNQPMADAGPGCGMGGDSCNGPADCCSNSCTASVCDPPASDAGPPPATDDAGTDAGTDAAVSCGSGGSTCAAATDCCSNSCTANVCDSDDGG